MTNVDVKQIRIARRYADALIQSAQANNELQTVYDELSFIKNTLEESPDLGEFLENPIITHLDKMDVANQIFAQKISSSVLNFITLLVENNRFDAFNAVLSEYLNKMDEINNIVKAKVVSAVELNTDAKSKLLSKLEQKVSKKVSVNYQVDPDIIAGLIIEINDKTIDTSIKTKLNDIKKQLI